MDFNNFAFLNILEYCFIGEKHGIGEYLAFFEGIALRNNPPLDFPLLIRILALIVLLAILKRLLIALLLIVFGHFLILLLLLLNSNQFGKFPQLVLDLLEFLQLLLQFLLVLFEGFLLFVALA